MMLQTETKFVLTFLLQGIPVSRLITNHNVVGASDLMSMVAKVMVAELSVHAAANVAYLILYTFHFMQKTLFCDSWLMTIDIL